jgi:glycosyltransferase involved in cell wall biosynthesis
MVFLGITAAAWVQLTLNAVWWGAGVLVMRALSLAGAGSRGRGALLTPWTSLLVLLNLVAPAALGVWLRFPTNELIGLTGVLVALDLVVALRHRDWSLVGVQSYVAVPAVALAFFAYALTVTLTTPMNGLGIAISAVLLAGELASAFIDLYYTGELINTLCRTRHLARMEPWHGPVATWPKVSVHVPAHNEPPELVIQTLTAITHLDYPNYEIILIDDNSADDVQWQPVMAFCRQQGIKSFHLMNYPGYKAGAVNFALQQTDPTAEVVAIVDADYLVRPNWLRETVPYFLQDPELGFLQTPQSFIYPAQDWFHHAAALAEGYFFAVGMTSRAERNSIIFCGTMGLIRRRVLERIGGWAEWCVTEDAEASLRVLARRYRGAYLNQVYGRGTLPPTLADLKRQHYRWAFGSIQITRAYIGLLLFGIGRREGDPRRQPMAGARPRLGRQQRYDYIMHGLHWYHAPLQIGLGIILNGIALLKVADVPFTLRPLVASALLLPLLGIMIGVVRVLWTSRIAMRCTWRDAWGVMIGLLAVHWAVTRACVAGLYRRRQPFLRTPRSGAYVTFGYALRTTSVELTLMLCALATIPLLLWRDASVQSILLSVMLLWQAFILSAAPQLAIAQAVHDRQLRRKNEQSSAETGPRAAVVPVSVERR